MAEQAGNSDLILENREKLTVTGVRRVLQCNAESAAIETARGVRKQAAAILFESLLKTFAVQVVGSALT